MDISPERWQKIEQLYHTALEREPGGRSAFLDQACQGDVELRREVEALLAQGDAAGDSTVTMLTPGAQLGPYQIEAQIGAGGMGSVYRAVDTRLGRKVAIKICAQQFSGRFEREARRSSWKARSATPAAIFTPWGWCCTKWRPERDCGRDNLL